MTTAIVLATEFQNQTAEILKPFMATRKMRKISKIIRRTARRMSRRCPKCHRSHKRVSIEKAFGYRKINGKKRRQSYCRNCR